MFRDTYLYRKDICSLPMTMVRCLSDMIKLFHKPYIVALMTELLELNEGNKVLEIGTGSGYQAAILYEMGCEVYTVEIIEPLGKKARKILESIGYDKIKL